MSDISYSTNFFWSPPWKSYIDRSVGGVDPCVQCVTVPQKSQRVRHCVVLCHRYLCLLSLKILMTKISINSHFQNTLFLKQNKHINNNICDPSLSLIQLWTICWCKSYITFTIRVRGIKFYFKYLIHLYLVFKSLPQCVAPLSSWQSNLGYEGFCVVLFRWHSG